jgi:hypothetical protein
MKMNSSSNDEMSFTHKLVGGAIIGLIAFALIIVFTAPKATPSDSSNPATPQGDGTMKPPPVSGPSGGVHFTVQPPTLSSLRRPTITGTTDDAAGDTPIAAATSTSTSSDTYNIDDADKLLTEPDNGMR